MVQDAKGIDMKIFLHIKSIRGYTLVLGMIGLLIGPYSQAQTCLEGDCRDGFGELDSRESFYVGTFIGGKWDGPGVKYNKETGAITMAYYQADQPTISIVEFFSGNLEFGYRKKNEKDGKMYLYNGFNFGGDGLYKFIDGRKSNLDFDFKVSKCLIGDCLNGFGAEYLISVDIRNDTAAFLFVGHYSAATWYGEGAYYEFNTGDFFVGKFIDNREWNGALINNEDGLASFMVDGKEIKTLGYEVPEVPPGQAKSLDGKKKGAFWKGLGDFAAESPGSGDEARPELRSEIFIVNRMSKKILKASVSTQQDSNWSADILGGELNIGQKAKLTIPQSHEKSCTVQVRVSFTDGRTATWKELDLCKYHKFELLPEGKIQPKVD